MQSDFYLLKNTKISFKSDFEFQNIYEDTQETSSKVILAALNSENFAFLNNLKKSNLETCVFIYLKPPQTFVDLNPWTEIFNTYSPSCVIESHSLKESHLSEAIHYLRKKEHNSSLVKLMSENTESSLLNMKDQLSDLQILEKKLLRNQKRIQNTHINEQLNLDCLKAIFNSKSVGNIEDEITSILQTPFRIDWVRILVSPSNILTELPTIRYQNQFETKIFDLDYDSKIQGKVIFASQKGRYIKESTVPLLQKISDALSLRLKQIATEDEIENSNLQWESTFKALPFKTALINKDFKVLEFGGRFNTSKIKKNQSSLCYEKFFSRNKPCEGCKLGDNFLVDHKTDSFEVNSKEIFDPINDEHYYLNFYRDFEVSTLGESGTATKVKLEELGVISGSIAHELNNPLGGIKILLELLKEDPNLSSAEEKKDLEVLINSTSKCINIVSELLNFTRLRKNGSEPDPRSLSDYFEQLKVFTQAYLLSDGIILEVVENELLAQKILSFDSSLSIKLLEAVAHLSKNLNKKDLSLSKTIYLSGKFNKEEELEITFSSIPGHSSTPTPSKQKPYTDPILITPSESSFEEFTSSNQEQTLTLKFSTEVKLNETLV